MKIASIQSSVSFGRALTTKEKKEYEKLQSEARKQLGTDKTTATIFDFSVPIYSNEIIYAKFIPNDLLNILSSHLFYSKFFVQTPPTIAQLSRNFRLHRRIFIYFSF